MCSARPIYYFAAGLLSRAAPRLGIRPGPRPASVRLSDSRLSVVPVGQTPEHEVHDDPEEEQDTENDEARRGQAAVTLRRHSGQTMSGITHPTEKRKPVLLPNIVISLTGTGQYNKASRSVYHFAGQHIKAPAQVTAQRFLPLTGDELGVDQELHGPTG